MQEVGFWSKVEVLAESPKGGKGGDAEVSEYKVLARHFSDNIKHCATTNAAQYKILPSAGSKRR